jgi:hypothetical protein
MSIEDQPTQQIRRPQAPTPMPGPLNPAYQPPVEQSSADSGSTEVLSLDDLLDGPSAPAPAPSTPVPPAPVASAPVSRVEPAAPRIGAVPVRSGQPTHTSSRLRGDAAVAWRGGLDRSRAWLTSGDNAVIVGTAMIAVLLLLAVALF